MEGQHNRDGDSRILPRPFQFSLRTLLVVTTVLAVGFSLLIASPVWVRGLTAVFVTVSLPAVLTVALVYGRGYLRTFSMAALFPASSTLLMMMIGPDEVASNLLIENDEPLLFVVALLAYIVCSGLAGVATRRIVESWHARREDR